MMSRATQVRRHLAQPWPDSSKELQNILAEPSHEATVMQVKCVCAPRWSSACQGCLFTQVVTLRWEETGEESLPKLHDIQPDGSGRLNWAAVKKDFCADVVKVEGATPSTPPRRRAEGSHQRLLSSRQHCLGCCHVQGSRCNATLCSCTLPY